MIQEAKKLIPKKLLLVICLLCLPILLVSGSKPPIQKIDKKRELEMKLLNMLTNDSAHIGIVKFKPIVADTVWAVLDTADSQIGIVFRVFPKGYSGVIETYVGLDMDTTVMGIRTATPAEGLKETPGLGDKINETEFKSQFIGKKEKEIRLKKDGGTLDAITGATISAQAVADGVRKGIKSHKKYLH
ncbi:MAG: FMN-binding protein [Candidatus Stahlbacteria bacterium]|nr:FMN-binding protein [Candidatus Stahlbacteria bacterium]